MSEFKFACPVCGQHILCDSSRSGSIMACPTCFQKITAPQASTTNDSKFILSGTKAAGRPATAITHPHNKIAPVKNRSLLGSVVWVGLIVALIAGALIFRGKLFKLFVTTTPTVHGTNVNGQATNQR